MEEVRLADAARFLRHVFIRNLSLPARLGVLTHEQGREQRILVSVDLAVEDDAARPLSRAPVGADDLVRTVDYAVVADRVRAIVGQGHVRLVETLAERIAEDCLRDPRVHLARIRVEKPDVMPDAEAVGVTVERRRR